MITEEQYKNLDNKLNAIYQILKGMNQSTVNTKPQSFTSPQTNQELIGKGTIDFIGLLKSISDDKSKQIVNSIYQNSYPTVTKGQYKLLMDIGNSNNFQI